MEFEKLKKIIVDVLNVDENEITMDLSLIHIYSAIIPAVFTFASCSVVSSVCFSVKILTPVSYTHLHTLFDITAFKIDDLGIFSAELDCNIGLWRIMSCLLYTSPGP